MCLQYQYFRFSILVMLLFSCSSNDKHEYFEGQLISPIDSLDVKLPVRHNDLNKWGYYYQGEDLFLYEYHMDWNNNLIINILDFEQGQYQESIQIDREGPNGFKSTGVYCKIVNKDSLFIFPMTLNKFYLYDFTGQIMDEFPYNSKDESTINGSGIFTDVAYFHQVLILPTINKTRFDDKYFFEKVIPLQTYSLKEKRFISSYSYPKHMAGKYWWGNLASTNINKLNDSLLVVDFPFSDTVRIYNRYTQEIEFIPMGINYQSFFLETPLDKGEEMKELLTEKEYSYPLAHGNKLYRVSSHLKSIRQKELPLNELMEDYPRVVTLINYNLDNKLVRYFQMPITRYFLPKNDLLYVGSISSWEDENQDTWRRFYVYKLD